MFASALLQALGAIECTWGPQASEPGPGGPRPPKAAQRAASDSPQRPPPRQRPPPEPRECRRRASSPSPPPPPQPPQPQTQGEPQPRRLRPSLSWRARSSCSLQQLHPAAAAIAEPLQWSILPSRRVHSANGSEPVASEGEALSSKMLVLHRPTHDPAREASGAYPYSRLFARRRRLWEVRVQARFKRLPRGPIYFGLETRYMPGHKLSGTAASVKRLMLRALRGFVGSDFYHSPGDDPAVVEGEPEPPTIAMPLWAIDQFLVSEPGEEPDLTSDLSRLGRRRTDGLKAYIRDMDDLVRNLSTEKVYTFCFWGVSQYLDGVNWELRGFLPGMRVDANKLCGAPPAYVVAYALDPEAGDRRHLRSQKMYYFQVALWSALRPPGPDYFLERGGGEVEEELAGRPDAAKGEELPSSPSPEVLLAPTRPSVRALRCGRPATALRALGRLARRLCLS